jgi:hypothetical protein
MAVSAAGLDEEARKYLAWRATKMIIPNASKTGREHSSIQSGEGSRGSGTLRNVRWNLVMLLSCEQQHIRQYQANKANERSEAPSKSSYHMLEPTFRSLHSPFLRNNL